MVRFAGFKVSSDSLAAGSEEGAVVCMADSVSGGADSDEEHPANKLNDSIRSNTIAVTFLPIFFPPKIYLKYYHLRQR
jgi:hypothetical protein